MLQIMVAKLQRGSGSAAASANATIAALIRTKTVSFVEQESPKRREFTEHQSRQDHAIKCKDLV